MLDRFFLMEIVKQVVLQMFLQKAFNFEDMCRGIQFQENVYETYKFRIACWVIN